MRLTILWVVLLIGLCVFVAMLDQTRRHPAHAITVEKTRAAEYAWMLVPWLIMVLSAAPAVHRLLALNR